MSENIVYDELEHLLVYVSALGSRWHLDRRCIHLRNASSIRVVWDGIAESLAEEHPCSVMPWCKSCGWRGHYSHRAARDARRGDTAAGYTGSV